MPKYDLKSDYKIECAREYFDKLIEKKSWIELKELRVPHSLEAHQLYWVWLACIAKETGRDKDELHYLYRAMFLPKDEDYILTMLLPELWNKIKKHVIEFRYFSGMNLVIDIISESTAISANKNPQDDARFSKYLDDIRRHARVNLDVILLTLKDKNFADFYRQYGYGS